MKQQLKMKQNTNLILFIISSIITIWVGFFAFDLETMTDYYVNSVYWFVTISFFLWIITVINSFLESSAISTDISLFDNVNRQSLIFIKTHYVAFLLSIFFIVLGYFSCKSDFRILADETNLLSDSQSIYELKQCFITHSAIEYCDGGKLLLKRVIDKRPAFFPYLLSIVHTLLGYRLENIFLLNLIFGILSLFLIYYLIQLIWGKLWGISGLILLASYPLFILYTNSGGFEVFNLFCSLVFFLCCYRFIEKPDAIRAELLILFIPIIGQSRYESILSIFVALPLVFYCLSRKEYSRLSYKFAIFPLLLIPSIWLRIVTNNPVSWEVEVLDERFGLESFFNNIWKSIIFYFSGEGIYGINVFVSFMALIGFIILLCNYFSKKNSSFEPSEFDYKKYRVYFVSICVFYILHALVRFVFSWIDLTVPIISRLGIIFLPFFVAMAIVFFEELFKKFNFNKAYVLLICVTFPLLNWHNTQKMNIILFNNYELLKSMKIGYDFLEKKFPNKLSYIVLRNKPNLYTPLGFSSVSFENYKEFESHILEHFYEKNCT